jgi:hypothetical protein
MRALTLGLWLSVSPVTALAQDEPTIAEEAEALDAWIGQQVLVLRTDGAEIPGALLGVTEQSLTVVKADGRILTVLRAEVEAVRLSETAAAPAPEQPAPVVPAPVEPAPTMPEPGMAPVRREAVDRVLVGAAYTGQYFDLHDVDGRPNPIDGAFFGGRAYRFFLFVDQDGRRLSQANAWSMMGDQDAYRRLSGQSVILPLQAGSTVLGVAGILTALSPDTQSASLPLILGGIGLGIASSSLRPIYERKRGRAALERAQKVYGEDAGSGE